MRQLFSIITICLNAPDIDATCRSIVGQDYADFEWIVIDGGSSQQTLEILSNYKWRMNYFVSEKDNGIYDAMNKGILQAHGEYLNFLNGGDKFFASHVLTSVAKFIKENPSDVIYGNTYFEPPRNIIQHPIVGDNICAFLYTSPLNHQSCFFKASCFSDCGLYDTKLILASDYKKLIELAKTVKTFSHINAIIASYDATGATAVNWEASQKEARRIIDEQFSAEEIRQFKISAGLINRRNAISNLRATLKKTSGQETDV